jgi:hypothetical protein
MELYKLLRFADKWTHLGSAITEQIDYMVDGKYLKINPNAIKAAAGLEGFNFELDKCFEEYWEWYKKEIN